MKHLKQVIVLTVLALNAACGADVKVSGPKPDPVRPNDVKTGAMIGGKKFVAKSAILKNDPFDASRAFIYLLEDEEPTCWPGFPFVSLPVSAESPEGKYSVAASVWEPQKLPTFVWTKDGVSHNEYVNKEKGLSYSVKKLTEMTYEATVNIPADSSSDGNFFVGKIQVSDCD
ncbi:MAG: hypothetical protein EBX52_14470 [Proteobacteria bacterium]|nr:hypothetical protein [Pseudomonadota bacterium]